jgi:hypothetical protein
MEEAGQIDGRSFSLSLERRSEKAKLDIHRPAPNIRRAASEKLFGPYRQATP